MTQLKQNKIIPLDRYLSLDLIDHEKTVYGIVANIHPKSVDQVLNRFDSNKKCFIIKKNLI